MEGPHTPWPVTLKLDIYCPAQDWYPVSGTVMITCVCVCLSLMLSAERQSRETRHQPMSIERWIENWIWAGHAIVIHSMLCLRNGIKPEGRRRKRVWLLGLIRSKHSAPPNNIKPRPLIPYHVTKLKPKVSPTRDNYAICPWANQAGVLTELIVSVLGVSRVQWWVKSIHN